MKISYAAVPLLFFLLCSQQMQGMHQSTNKLQQAEKIMAVVEQIQKPDSTTINIGNVLDQQMEAIQKGDRNSRVNQNQAGPLALILALQWAKEDELLNTLSEEQKKVWVKKLQDGRADALNSLSIIIKQYERCSQNEANYQEINERLKKIDGNQSHFLTNYFNTFSNQFGLLLKTLIVVGTIVVIVLQTQVKTCTAPTT